MVLLILAVAGGVFAQEVAFSGQAIGTVKLAEGDSIKDSDITAAGIFGRMRLDTAVQNDEETFGAWIRFEAGDPTFGRGEGTVVNGWGLAWWQPIQYVKFQVGANPDGHFGADGIATWGFYANAGDVDVVHWNGGNGFYNSFFGGYGVGGAILTIMPIEGLDINVAVPFESWSGARFTEAYGRLTAQVAYTLTDIGKIAVTFDGDHGDHIDLTPSTTTNSFDIESNGSTIFGYFGLTAIENLIVDFGVGFKLPVKVENLPTPFGITNVTYNTPVAIGLAGNYELGQINLRARVQGEFAGKLKVDQAGFEDAKIPFRLTADILPSYGVNDMLRIFFSAGIIYTAKTEYMSNTLADSTFGWHINPYVTVTQGGGNFYAGFRLDSNGEKQGTSYSATTGLPDGKTVINWSIPVGIVYIF